MPQIPWLEGSSTNFPHPSSALTDPDGLLAAGGNLSPEQLLHAYRHGIFPWFDDTQPILWWSPNPRLVIKPADLHLSKSLRKVIRRDTFTVTSDRCFNDVMLACAEPRDQQDGTWITEEMLEAYNHLHELGHAHSIEVWEGDALAGGLYGIAIGQVFFGESMFSRASNASKVGFTALLLSLREANFQLVDCQVQTDHLQSLGASEVEREHFLQMLVDFTEPPSKATWPATSSWREVFERFKHQTNQ